MGIFRSSFWFSFGTLLSRVSGLIRESVVAGVFGPGLALDTFLVANRIPNMLRDFFAEGALGSSFTRNYSRLGSKNFSAANSLLFSMIFWVGVIGLPLVVLGWIFAPEIVGSLTMGLNHGDYDVEFREQTVFLMRILLPFVLLMAWSSLFAGVLHYNNRFFWSAFSPIWLNLGYIGGAVLFGEELAHLFANLFGLQVIVDYRIFGLAMGVIVGGTSQTIWLLCGIEKFWNLWVNPKLFSNEVRNTLVLMGPMIIAAGSAQLNVFVNTNFATSLDEGSVSWLSFAFRLLQLPVGLLAVAVGSVVLPRLSKCSPDDSKEFGKVVSKASVLLLWMLLPCLLFYLLNCDQVVNLVYRHGSFSSFDAEQTSLALFCYTWSMIGYGFLKLLTSCYYALDRTSYAMRVSLLGVLINLIANWLLVSRYGFSGLAISLAVVMNGNALLLIWGIRSNYRSILDSKSRIIISLFYCALFIILASVLHFGVLYLLDHQYSTMVVMLGVKFGSVLKMLLSGLGILLSLVFVTCLRLKLRPFDVVRSLLSPNI